MILWMESVWNARICVLAALLPAIYLMLYIYRLDRVEKEPPSVLLQLAGYGVLAALLAIAFEAAFEDFLLPVLNITDTTVLAIVTATGVGRYRGRVQVYSSAPPHVGRCELQLPL